MNRKIIYLFSLLMLTACTHPAARPVALMPEGRDLSGPPVIKAYESNFDSGDKKSVPLGAKITSIDGKQTDTINDVIKQFYRSLRSQKLLKDVTIRKNNSETTIPAVALYDPNHASAKVSLLENNEHYIFPEEATGLDYPSVVVRNNGLIVQQMMIFWATNPPMIEVMGAYRASGCKKCSFDNVIVKDKGTRSKLDLARLDYAAYKIYPDLGPLGQTVAVPSPTVVGFNSYSTTTGTLYGNSYGNNFYGNYSGYTNTTTTPVYDYSAQNAAAMQNLAVAIHNSSVQKQNSARAQLFQSRVGNLKVGSIQPDSIIQGSVFYLASPMDQGPFEVTTILGGKEFVSTFSFSGK